MRKIFVAFALSLLLPAATPAQDNESRGRYFYKKEYVPAALPLFEESRAMLPSPVWDKNPEWVRLYWKAWEIAFSNLRQPPAGSPLVANWIDEGLSPQVFQWLFFQPIPPHKEYAVSVLLLQG